METEKWPKAVDSPLRENRKISLKVLYDVQRLLRKKIVNKI